MKGNKLYISVCVWLAACFLLVFTSFTFGEINEKDTTSNLFSEFYGHLNMNEDLPGNSRVIRQRAVKINFYRMRELEIAARGNKVYDFPLTLNLFEDVVLEARVKSAMKISAEGFSYIGKIEGEPLSEVVLVMTRDIFSANISVYGQLYQVRNTKVGIHTVQEIDGNKSLPGMPPVEVQLDDYSHSVENLIEPDDSGHYIDVLVVYTETARLSAGGTKAMKNRINPAVATTNSGYANSTAIQRLRDKGQAK